MRSIWLDEDQDAEKLYAQQFMGSDEEDSVAIKMVNSDKPLLNNKKRIELPPLSKNSMMKCFETSPSVTPMKKKKRKGLLGFFKGKEIVQAKRISTPFAFQHISHANTKAGFESDQDDGEKEDNSPTVPIETSDKQGPLHKAFVTQSIPEEYKDTNKISDRKRASMISRRSLSGSISTHSSNNSRSSAGRIVSSSTMATSIHHESSSSPSRLTLLNIMEKSNGKFNATTSDKESNVSLDFLKNYNFPTLLDPKTANQGPHDSNSNITPIIEVAVSEMNSIKIDDLNNDDDGDSDEEEEDLRSIHSLPVVNKTNSYLKSSRTPDIENEWFGENTRKSVDDILLCYHTPSESGSFVQSPFTSPKKSIV